MLLQRLRVYYNFLSGVFTDDTGESSAFTSKKIARYAIILLVGIVYGLVMFIGQTPEKAEPLQYLFIFLRSVLLAPIFEELVYRRILLGLLRHSGKLPFWIVNLAQASVFAMFHSSVPQAIKAFVFALIAGYVYNKTNKLGYCIVMHAVANLVVLVLGVVSVE